MSSRVLGKADPDRKPPAPGAKTGLLSEPCPSAACSEAPLGPPAAGPTAQRPHGPATDRWIARQLLQALGDPPIGLVLSSGEEICGDGPPLARVILRSPGALWKLALSPEMHFGEAYSAGQIEVEGDLLGLIETLFRAMSSRPPGLLRRVFARWRTALQVNSLRGSRRNIHHHYDIGNDFYRLWLDEQMVYTCGYFPDPAMTLDEGQVAKMDYVCRKLRLRPGETVVEAGCGWGALALHMARHCGAIVKALNISHEQIVYARQRAAAEGLDSRVQFIEDDYRNLAGRYDVFVSVGMLEHVGRGCYRDLGKVIDRCVGSSGRGLIHAIGRDAPSSLSPWIRRRIFPGAYPPTLREMMQVLEPYHFSVLDLENLRLHYAETLRHWLERFNAAAGTVAKMFDDRFVRMWRLYLTGSTAAFNTGELQLFQLLFARPGVNDVPRSRAHLYQ